MPSNGLKILEWNNERIAALSIATTDERTRGPHNPAGWEFEPPLVNFKDRTEVRQRFQDYMNRVISQMLETKMRGGIFLNRSEERRVGKECICRLWKYDEKNIEEV